MKLNADILSLLDGPVAITIATCDADHVPSLAHAYGCRWDSARGRLRVFLLADEARPVLAGIAAFSPVAAVFSDVRSFHSLQVKGDDATLVSFDAADMRRREAHHRRVSAALVAQGFAPDSARGYFDVPADAGLLTLAFTPRDLFQQTPGPDAGRRIALPPLSPAQRRNNTYLPPEDRTRIHLRAATQA